jgi:hypothetical protein
MLVLTVGEDVSFHGLYHGFLSGVCPFWSFMAQNAPKGEPHVRIVVFVLIFVFIRQIVFRFGQSGP